jgi:hypothetical protein
MTEGWPTYFCSLMTKKNEPLKFFENLDIIREWCPLRNEEKNKNSMDML